MIIIGSYCLSTSASFANVTAFSQKIYRPILNNTERFSFELKTDYLKKLMATKTPNIELKDSYAYIVNENGKLAVNLVNSKGLPQNIEKKIKKIFLSKAKMVLPDDIPNWLGDHKYIKDKDGYSFYEDESGLLETSVIKVKAEENTFEIIEIRPTGEITTLYIYSVHNWSNGKLVLDRVRRTSSEGNQSTTVETQLLYKYVKGLGWLLHKLNTETSQEITSGVANDVIRKLSEHYEFVNYKIGSK